MNTEAQQVIIFAGRSGSGKGTQVALLKQKLPGKVMYIATGDYFRKMISESTLTGDCYRDAYARGELAPNFLVTTYLGNTFINEYTGTEHLLFDGVARMMPEAEALTEMFRYYKISNPKVIFMDVSIDWSRDRLENRGRIDDKSMDVKNAWFEEQAKPVLEFFKKDPLYTVITINGEQTIEEVHQEILSKL